MNPKVQIVYTIKEKDGNFYQGNGFWYPELSDAIFFEKKKEAIAFIKRSNFLSTTTKIVKIEMREI